MTSSRRRVLFLIPSLAGGGAERVIVTLLRHLDRSKFKLALAIVDMHGAVFADDVPEDVEFIDLQCSRVRYALPKIIRLIWQRRPDVVFSTLGHLNLALAVLRPVLPDSVRYLARETTVVTEGLRGYAHPGWWAWAYRRFYGRFDRVICQSQYMRDDLIANFELSADKAVVINNPVDIERIRRLSAEVISTDYEPPVSHSDAAPHLVAAGRLSHEKGFDLLIEALALCNGIRPRLTLLGEGPLRPALEELAQQRGVGDRVRFLGFQKNPYPFFAQADAFVLSSRYEGFPNVVLEALASCTPVIATPAPGGVREILGELDGCLLAASVTARDLAYSIQSFFRRPVSSALSLNVIRRFSIASIIYRYEQALTGEPNS